MAAFECKTTLRPRHLAKLFANAVAIADTVSHGRGTFYDETFGPTLYGLLAHSHEGFGSDPRGAIDCAMVKFAQGAVSPRMLPSVLCVSDLGTWQKHISVLLNLNLRADGSVVRSHERLRLPELAVHCFLRRWLPIQELFGWPSDSSEPTQPNPISELIFYLTRAMAVSDPTRTPLADYCTATNPSGVYGRPTKSWSSSEIFSEDLLNLVGSKQWSVSRMINPKNRSPLP